MKYSNKNRFFPILSSTNPPNTRRTYILTIKWYTPLCRNIEVTNIHGLTNACPLISMKELVKSAPNNHCSIKKTKFNKTNNITIDLIPDFIVNIITLSFLNLFLVCDVCYPKTIFHGISSSQARIFLCLLYCTSPLMPL